MSIHKPLTSSPQFFERILIIFMPQKYQPDYVFLRHVPTYKVHIFTLIQVLCFALLWGVKSYKKISITFPLMLVVIILIRKLLDFCFSRQELKILDDIMPESTKRKKEEEKELCKSDAEGGGGAGSPGLPGSPGGNIISNISSGNMTIQMANGNVMKVPVSPKAADAEPALNITVAMSKSAAWQSVNTKNGGGGGKNSTSNASKNQNQQNQQQQKKRGTAKDAKSEEEQKRLSTMREEDDEEDCGITIKVEAPTPVPHKGAGKDADGETPV